MIRTVTPIALALFALVAPPPPPAHAQGDSASATTRSVRDGVYTAGQAERGAEVFGTVCANCHAASQFTGPEFVRAWRDRSAADLFTLIRTTMPLDNPGGLRREQYVDVLALVFRLNGLPPGTRELPGTLDSLRQIVIESPAPPAPPPEE